MKPLPAPVGNEENEHDDESPTSLRTSTLSTNATVHAATPVPCGISCAAPGVDETLQGRPSEGLVQRDPATRRRGADNYRKAQSHVHAAAIRARLSHAHAATCAGRPA